MNSIELEDCIHKCIYVLVYTVFQLNGIPLTNQSFNQTDLKTQWLLTQRCIADILPKLKIKHQNACSEQCSCYYAEFTCWFRSCCGQIKWHIFLKSVVDSLWWAAHSQASGRTDSGTNSWKKGSTHGWMPAFTNSGLKVKNLRMQSKNCPVSPNTQVVLKLITLWLYVEFRPRVFKLGPIWGHKAVPGCPQKIW